MPYVCDPSAVANAYIPDWNRRSLRRKPRLVWGLDGADDLASVMALLKMRYPAAWKAMQAEGIA